MFDKDDWLNAMRILSQQAQDAVACSYCFMPERTGEWNRPHPMRPPDRTDDVALAPWVGSRYSTANPRVVVVMMNPGHATAPHKLTRRDLGQQLKKRTISYEVYNRKLAPLVPEWGFGGIVRWLHALNLDRESIAFLNIALCAVANDDYFAKLFETCFSRHTRKMVATLKPQAVLLCGKKELEPYEESIKSLGTNVILTWHYRPMNTGKGKLELQRVRAELDKLAHNEARMSWDHDKVYAALVARGEREKQSDTDKYVTLYPQKLNCAILYRSDTDTYHRAPVHLHYHSIPPHVHGYREGWKDEIFAAISPALEFVKTDKPNQEDQAFSCYQVSDWDKLAEALGLK